MHRRLPLLIAALWFSSLLCFAEADAKPEAKSKAGVVSLLQKSTTHFPNHYASQVSSLNVDHTQDGYNKFKNPLLTNVQYHPHYPVNGYPYAYPFNNRFYNNLPLVNSPNYFNYYKAMHPNLWPDTLATSDGYLNKLLSYSLSPIGDRGWAFGNPSNLNGINRLGGLSNPLPHWNPAALYSPSLLPRYPLPHHLYPYMNNLNLTPTDRVLHLNALERLRLNQKYLSDGELLRPDYYKQYGSLLPVTGAVHNAHALAKSKETDYKMKKD